MASKIQNNNTSLEEILAAINALPEGKDDPVYQEKTVTPTASVQTVTPDSGYDALSEVTVNAIPSSYVEPTATKAATTYTPTTSDQTIAARTYCSGTQTIKGDTNLVAGNIKSGVSIFGVAGSYEGSGGDSGGGFPNGMKWTQSNLTEGRYSKCAYGNGVWVAVGDYSSYGVYYSLDGKTWTISNLTTGGFWDVKYHDGMFVVAGRSSGLYYSRDGRIWTQSNITNVGFARCEYNNGVWIALQYSEGSGIYYSLDGMSWVQGSIADSRFLCTDQIIYANGKWLINDRHDMLYDSYDGITWSETIKYYNFVNYSNGIYVSGGSNVGVPSKIDPGLNYSVDGTTWTKSNITDGNFIYAAYFDGAWLAYRYDDPSVYTSTDGKVWNKVSSSEKIDNSSTEIYRDNGIYLANTYDNGAHASYSLDGKVWINCDGALAFRYAMNHNGIWVACGLPGMWYSVTWEPST